MFLCRALCTEQNGSLLKYESVFIDKRVQSRGTSGHDRLMLNDVTYKAPSTTKLIRN